MPHVNWLAVLAAALSSFLLGGIWYSALFSKAWQAAAGVSDAAMAQSNKGLIFGGAFVLSLVQSAVFALFLGPNPSPMLGVGAGFAAGLCWVTAAIGMNYLFERRGMMLFAINGGYATLQFTAIGAILGFGTDARRVDPVPRGRGRIGLFLCERGRNRLCDPWL